MALNMRSLTQALAKTAAVIEKTVQTTVQEVAGPKPLLDYELLHQIGSGGPGLWWKLYSAKPRGSSTSQYRVACVWILDKRALSDARLRAGLSKASEEAFLDIIRADAARLVRLRHPGVVHVLQSLDENKNTMAMVTEPIFASVANILGMTDNIVELPKELNGMTMGLLEVKHGLLLIAESLAFLHSNARLVHRAISPEVVFITASGAWKLGGFGFATSADASGDSARVLSFHYSEYDVEDSLLPLQPSLDYTAPEIVQSKGSTVSCASDIFSLACFMYHILAHKPLFDCHNNVKMYTSKLTYMSSDAFTCIPIELSSELQIMLSVDDSFRPSALDFTGSLFFRSDTKLRALRFLDHMLERDNLQKSEFLKDLADMWKDFDARVLRYKVLPPLCAELRNMVLQPIILPMVLIIAKSQDKNDFELSTLPSLIPVLSSASGETLLLILKNADLILNKTTEEQLTSHLLPLLIRAYEDGDVRIQEEVLRRTASLAKQVDVKLVNQVILPRVHGLALRTTIAAVRVSAFLCLGDMIHLLDKSSTMEVLQTVRRCTAVDHSAPTLMCALAVANSVLKKYGSEFAAEYVLPMLCPLLVAQQLNLQQFSKYMMFIQDILRKLEEKRGVTLSNPKISNEAFILSGANGFQTCLPQRTEHELSVKKCSSWDGDWRSPSGVVSNISVSMPDDLTILANSSVPNFVASSHLDSISVISASKADVQWPPVSQSSQPGGNKSPFQKIEQNTSYLNDIDPFANWPPSSSDLKKNQAGVGHPSINVSGGVDQSESSVFGVKPVLKTSGVGAQTFDASGIDIGWNSIDGVSAFASVQPMPKLAPPPSSAMGRVGGIRGLGISQSNRSKQSDKPHILDLL